MSLNADEPIRVSVGALPERGPRTRESFDPSTGQVRRWVAALPVANLSRSARRLYETLGEVNRTEIDPGERFRLLETLREPLARICEDLERRYLGGGFPLPASQYRIASLNRRFQQAMATGYKLVAQDLIDHPPPVYRRLIRPAPLCTALHRALRYTGRVLLSCYQIYAPYPENTWREIHHLYRVAERLGCLDRPIPDDYRFIRESTLTDAYKQVLLFALASPYRLRPGESSAVYDALELWSPHCMLAPIPAEPRGDVRGVFGLQPETDQQPYHMQLGPEHPGRTTRVLDTGALGGLLRHQLHQLKHGGREELLPAVGGMSEDLLRRLMRSWGMVTERRHERRRNRRYAEVVLGLSGVHRALSAGTESGAGGADGSAQRGMEQVTLEGDSGASWVTLAGPGDERPLGYICTIRDEAPEGLRLQWHGNEQLRVAVGDLIAVRAPAAEHASGEWAVGSIRWMRHRRTDLLQFGVQLFRETAVPVTVKPCSADRVCARPVLGLELVPGEAAGMPTLITPGFLEHFDRPEVMVVREASEQLWSLSRLVESSGVFARFEYEEAAEPRPRSEGQDLEADTDFTKLWDHL